MQILLEICLPTEEEKGQSSSADLLRDVQSPPGPEGGAEAEEEEEEEEEQSLLCNLREVQCLICCLLHQMYIADPNIVKLVHFQVCSALLQLWFALSGWQRAQRSGQGLLSVPQK